MLKKMKSPFQVIWEHLLIKKEGVRIIYIFSLISSFCTPFYWTLEELPPDNPGHLLTTPDSYPIDSYQID